MRKINFVCPNCGEEDSLEEINRGLICYRIIYIEKEENGAVDIETDPEVSEPFIDLEERLGYACCACGYMLKGDLYDWLEERGMISAE